MVMMLRGRRLSGLSDDDDDDDEDDDNEGDHYYDYEDEDNDTFSLIILLIVLIVIIIFHMISQVTHSINYMLANNLTESDRVVREKGGGGSLKRSPQHMKEVIYTQIRDHLKQLFKGSLKMLNN